MRKIIALTLSLLMVFAAIPMATIASADTVKANALVITQENLDQYLQVGTKAKKNDSAWTMQTNDNVTVEADGTISYSMEKGSTIGNVNFFFLKKALNQNLIQKAGGAIVVEISNTGLQDNQTVHLFRLPFSNENGTNYNRGITPDASYSYNITLPESEYSQINSDEYADDIRGEGVVDNRANLFMAQMYSSKYNTYAAPEKISIRVYVQVDESLLKEPTTDAISTENKAAIRLNESDEVKNGIRFYTAVDTAKLAELAGENTYEIGTLIAPADKVTGELTHKIGEANYVDVKYLARNEDDSVNYYKDSTGFSGIVGTISNVKDTNIARDFVARAYVKVGETYYYSVSTSTRSLRTVAQAIKDDSSVFENYDEVAQGKINDWAAAADWSAQ